MSDTVEASIITGISVVLVAVIGIIFKSKKHSQPQRDKQDILSNVGSISGSVINVNSPQATTQQVAVVTDAKSQPTSKTITDQLIEDLREARPKPITDLTHKEICDAIEAAPPFHQDKIHESFIGKRVTWQSKLGHISHFKDSTKIYADIPNEDGMLICKSSPENSEVFISATTGTDFKVTGEIKRISRYDVELENCTYQMLKRGST
jgi:hypothetical protein